MTWNLRSRGPASSCTARRPTTRTTSTRIGHRCCRARTTRGTRSTLHRAKATIRSATSRKTSNRSSRRFAWTRAGSPSISFCAPGSNSWRPRSRKRSKKWTSARSVRWRPTCQRLSCRRPPKPIRPSVRSV
uniref:(northern house mosquito) hypothetical protein n=1 Tax=Culex pipiens TaxID=7175 RepID=A0A8D8K6E4_CULPI